MPIKMKILLILAASALLLCSFSLTVSAKVSVTQFSLHNHLTTPTRRDLRDGVENSHRLRRNLRLLPKESQEKQRRLLNLTDSESDVNRDLLADSSVYDYDAKGFFTPYKDDGDQVDKNPSEVDLAEMVKALPYGDGPGVRPAHPKATRDFWEAIPNAKPTQMWEVVACPVVVRTSRVLLYLLIRVTCSSHWFLPRATHCIIFIIGPLCLSPKPSQVLHRRRDKPTMEFY